MRIWEKIKKDDLLRHSTLLFISMVMVHGCNMLFQMVVGRKLPKEEFALLAAFLAALMIIQRPLGALRTAMSHYSSLLEADGRRGDVKRLLRKWLLLTSLPSIIGGLLVVVFSDTLAAYFHVDRPAPVMIAGALLPALCWLPIVNGAAQGLERFRLTASSAIIGAVVRLFLGAGFTVVLYRACGWAMLGHGLSIYVTVGVVLIGLWLLLHGHPSGSESLPSMRLYMFHSFFTVAAYAVLMTADVVLVKHYLPEDPDFSFAATLGRTVAFLPGAIAVAMFPKVTSKGALTREQRRVFFRSFGYTAMFVLVGVVGCALLPGLLKIIFYGKKAFSPEFSHMIRLMAVVMGFSALLNINVQFLLAQRRFKACAVVVLSGCGYLLCGHFFHESAWQIATAAAVFNLLALVTTTGCILFIRHEPTAPRTESGC